MDAATVTVNTPGSRYDIVIGHGLLARHSTFDGLPPAAQAVVVSNLAVDALHGAALRQALAPHYAKVGTVLLPDGEAYKDWQALNRVYDHLLTGGCDRRTVLFALGGGVVGDIAGFAAATYMRGVPVVQVPTTLLAQVDSSVGGKTAVNHPLGKNMIGAFHQPLRVVCDLGTLATLPQRELAAGLAEVIKYGPIADAAFLDWIDEHLDVLVARDAAALAHAVRRSCELKAGIVSRDERETGLRAILNFGHTFGHAIEAGVGYGRWLHGEAVGCGMVLAAELSARLGLVPTAFVERLTSIVARAGLPVQPPVLPVARWLELMRVDKKAEDGAIHFVVIDAPGNASKRPVADSIIAAVIASRTPR